MDKLEIHRQQNTIKSKKGNFHMLLKIRFCDPQS